MSNQSPPVLFELGYGDGQWFDHAVPVADAGRNQARKGQIYILADVDGVDDPIRDDVIDQIIDDYYSGSSGSLTSILSRAIQQVNDDLWEQNAESLRSERHYLTLICVIVRGAEAYFAQVGRALTYITTERGVDTFGRGDPQTGDRPVVLLGQGETAEIEFYRRSVGPRTTILLASSGLASWQAEGAVEQALGSSPADVTRLWRDSARTQPPRRPFRALLIMPVEADSAELIGSGRASGALTRSAPPSPPSRASNGRRNGLSPSPVVPPPPPPARRREPVARAWNPDDEVTGAEPKLPIPRPLATAPRERPRRNSRRPGIDRAERLKQALPIIRVVAIGLLVCALFAFGFTGVLLATQALRSRPTGPSADAIFAQAQQREAEALNQSDPLARRRLLGEALTLVNEAFHDVPGNSTVAAAADQIRQQFDQAVGVRSLSTPTRLVDLPAPADQIVVAGGQLYALDRHDGVVYHYVVADLEKGTVKPGAAGRADAVIVRTGDHIGNYTVTQLAQMTWMPAGSARPQSDLLILDRSGFLIQYDPSGGRKALPLLNPSSWGQVTALSGYGGSLYALDPSQQTLAWYPPGPTDFAQAVYNYFAPGVKVDLSNAAAFGIDGDLFLLHTDGHIEKYVAGHPSSFAGPPADLLPVNPAGLAVGKKAIYIGDPTHRWILQMSKSGDYQGVWRDGPTGAIVASMKDLAVDDADQALFVLAGKTVYRFGPMPATPGN